MTLLSAALVVVPNPTPAAPPGMEGLTIVLSWAGWIVLVLCVLGVLITAGMMAVANRRGEGGEHAGRLGFVLVATVLVGAAGGLVGALA
ncbi:hypothetical protein [uncultured Pseudokineococcus sp.]|uniref:hypothetical protein n=1 Tax=uncultured Pseudokineococcus sp. TaxID=1642928 RepID=UPI0026109880|nr:hypothetical protein [uncultured Pseudokineococcus sp.]